MNLFAKGKVVREEGDLVTIELSNDELGRAVLNYVINSADKGIGERFMQNLFAGKPMTLNELLVSNMVEARKMSESKESINNENETTLKKNSSIVSDEVVEDNLAEDTLMIDEAECDFDKIQLLKEAQTVQVRILDIEKSCKHVYERVVKTKNGISSQIISNCEIAFTFEENNVTYSFVNYKKGVANVITPNNNLVFIWDDATTEELDELITLI